MDSRLIGIWESEPDDTSSIARYGSVRLHFFQSGELIYTIRSHETDQIVRLTYSANGEIITTQQPSSPREEQTKYSVTEDGQLRLDYDGVVSRYRRLRETGSSDAP